MNDDLFPPAALGAFLGALIAIFLCYAAGIS